MRPTRIVVLAIGFAVTAGLVAFSVIEGLQPGPIDREAAHRLAKLCSDQPKCNVNIHDIIPGDWDTFQEFGPHQMQEDIDDALGVSSVPTSEMQRILIFKKRGAIQRVVYEDFGVERPMHDEIVFEEEYRSTTPTYVTYTPQQQLRVTLCPTDKAVPFWRFQNGTYYMLTPLPLESRRPPSC